jgi:hypothetical protein
MTELIRDSERDNRIDTAGAAVVVATTTTTGAR